MTFRPFLRKGIKILLAAIVIGFGGCFMQRAMLYQPGRYPFETAKALAEQKGLRLWPAANSSYLGLVTQWDGQPQGTVVVFHGNAGIAGFRVHYAVALEGLGYRVLLAEYPGYGGRPGSMSEESFATDAAAILELAREEFGAPIYVWGESLGSAVVAAAMARVLPTPEGLVMFTPWDSLLNVARAHFPFLPVRLLMKDNYDNVSNLAHYQGPTAVVVAARDEVVPQHLGKSLFHALPGRKRLWTMQGAGHNDWQTSPANPLWREVMGYLASGTGDLE